MSYEHTAGKTANKNNAIHRATGNNEFQLSRGGAHPEELVAQAHWYGYRDIAITDRNTLAGVVRAHAAARTKGTRIIIGCRLDLVDGVSLLAYPTNNDAYAQLCMLLTKGNRRTEKANELFKGMCMNMQRA